MIYRRFFLLGGFASIVVLPSGCLFLLARLALRGGLLRAGARGLRRGRAGTVNTFGRGAGAAVQAVRIARLTRGTTRILRLDDKKEAGAVDVDDDGAACKTPGGDTITYSNRDGRYLIHYSRLYNVECGRTKAIDNDNYHYDYRNRFIGSDRIDGKSVKHYDGDGNSIGESRVVSGGEVPQLKSNRLAGELERMAKRGGLADPRIAEKYQEIERIMSVCNTTYPPRWCQDSHIRVANLLRQLEN